MGPSDLYPLGMLRSWATASLVTLCLDLLWLGVLAKDLYRARLGHLMADSVRWPAAFLFYLLYGWGVTRFCVLPSPDPARAAASGAFLGLLVYGTYDLTNMAVLRGWGGAISAVDILWGVALTAGVAAAGRLAAGAGPA